MSASTSSASTEPPASIISRVDELGVLLQNLPKSLPFDPDESKYKFGLDLDDIQEEGYWFALNCNLEIAFEIYKLGDSPLKISEQSSQFPILISMIKEGLYQCPKERCMIQSSWIERLIDAAKLSGATDPLRYAINELVYVQY